MLVISAGIHKMLDRIADREVHDQTASSVKKQSYLDLPSVSRPFWRATSVQSFRTFT